MIPSMPKSFKEMCGVLDQSIPYRNPPLEELIQMMLDEIDVEKMGDTFQYVDRLLSGFYTDEALRTLWRQTPSDFRFEDGAGVRRLLTLVRDALARRIAGEGG